jgi:hypothetical protein
MQVQIEILALPVSKQKALRCQKGRFLDVFFSRAAFIFLTYFDIIFHYAPYKILFM